MTLSKRNRRPSLSDDLASMKALHVNGDRVEPYRQALNGKRQLSRFERLCLGHTIDRQTERSFSRAEMRIAEINRLIEHRHGGRIPAHDDPHDGYVFAIAVTIHAEFADEHDRRSFLLGWISRAAEWITDRDAYVGALLAKMHPRGKHLRDRQAGQLVNLKAAERTALGIRTMSPADMTPLQFAKARQEAKRLADRERAARKRREGGAKPQERSIAKTQPWKAAGCSKATWYRRKRQNETVSSHACAVSQFGDETVSSPLIDSRIGCDETVSQVLDPPPIQPSLSDLMAHPEGCPKRPHRDDAGHDTEGLADRETAGRFPAGLPNEFDGDVE